ncbi:MAG TPA: DoxX family protein, partial [Haloferula sp.]
LAPVMEACQKMGISPDIAVGIGLLLLVCTAIYLVPRTAILGAILLTGYLGGAAATRASAFRCVPHGLRHRLRRSCLARDHAP